jgi:hypothetical protein
MKPFQASAFNFSFRQSRCGQRHLVILGCGIADPSVASKFQRQHSMESTTPVNELCENRHTDPEQVS